MRRLAPSTAWARGSGAGCARRLSRASGRPEVAAARGLLRRREVAEGDHGLLRCGCCGFSGGARLPGAAMRARGSAAAARSVRVVVIARLCRGRAGQTQRSHERRASVFLGRKASPRRRAGSGPREGQPSEDFQPPGPVRCGRHREGGLPTTSGTLRRRSHVPPRQKTSTVPWAPAP